MKRTNWKIFEENIFSKKVALCRKGPLSLQSTLSLLKSILKIWDPSIGRCFPENCIVPEKPQVKEKHWFSYDHCKHKIIGLERDTNQITLDSRTYHQTEKLSLTSEPSRNFLAFHKHLVAKAALRKIFIFIRFRY